MSLLELKSGTDIRGTALSYSDGEEVQLNDEAVRKITQAFAYFIAAKTGKDRDEITVAVGHDSRVSADRIKQQVIAMLLSSGINVKNCELCSTPAMFMTTKLANCDAAVQITASHHPFDRNGLKFFTAEGGLSGDEIAKILEVAETMEGIAYDTSHEAEQVNFMETYSEYLCDMVKKGVNSQENYDKPLEGLKIVVDAGNGAGGFFAYDVLEKLGADITGSRYLEPDGMFPNHVPNPEDKVAMSSIKEATIESFADLGVIFDTDVDRAACVSADGSEINRNRLVALAAAIALEGNDGGTIVTDSVTSAGLTEFINETLGGVHRRFKRGYKNVIDESIRLCREGVNSPLAIETSGHAAFRENYFLDDGAYLMVKIIIKLAALKKQGKTLDDLISELKMPYEERAVRLNIKEENFREYAQTVIDKIEKSAILNENWTVADDSCEGVKIIFNNPECDGFFIMRMSVHDPVMPVNIESAVPGGCMRIATALLNALALFDGLDLEPLQALAGFTGNTMG